MKAVVYEKYGPPEVLQMKEVAKPTPRDHEVLVKVYATTAHIGDTIMRSLNLPGASWQKIPMRIYLGIFKPKRPILGMELAGQVEAVGKNVTLFKVGDPVMVSTFSVNFGGYAEYKCMPEDGMLTIKPSNLTYEEAAAAPAGGMTALICVKKAKLRHGQKILIYGASGSVGTYAVQIAKNHFGAEVMGVCGTRNLDMVMSLGADKVIDYTKQDVTQINETYDVIFDAVGKLPAEQGKQLLKQGGIYLDVMKDSGTKEKLDNLQELKDLIEEGEVKPVIDRCYPLEEIVEAHRYAEKGHKKGNVVIVVAEPPTSVNE